MDSQLEHKVVVADGSGKKVEILLTEDEKMKMESLPGDERVPFLHQLVSETPSKLKEAEPIFKLDPSLGSASPNDSSDLPRPSTQNEDGSTDDKGKGGIDLESLDYGKTSGNPNAEAAKRLASMYQESSDSVAPMLLASVEQANMLEPAAPIVDMSSGIPMRTKPRFGIMIVGAIFTKNLEIKEGAIEALKELQGSCETEDEMVLVLEDTRSPPDLSELEDALGYEEGKIWNIIRSCRGFELLSLMSSGSGDGAFDYLIENGKVQRFEAERCFNLKSHYRMDNAWITKEDGLYVGNWPVCLQWIQEKRSLPLTISINVESWPVDDPVPRWSRDGQGNVYLLC